MTQNSPKQAQIQAERQGTQNLKLDGKKLLSQLSAFFDIDIDFCEKNNIKKIKT